VASSAHSGRETVDVTAGDERPDGFGDTAAAQVEGGGAAVPEEPAGSGAVQADDGSDGPGAEALPEAAAGDGSADDAPAEPGPSRRRTLPVLLAVAALALLLDVVSKLLVVEHLSDRGPVHVPGGFLNLTLVRNSGAAFSIGESQTWVFTIIAVAVVVAILRVSRNLRSIPWACALGLLLGGALGNLGDRIFRSPGLFRGHVVDFLQFPTFPVVHYDFPVFNLADSSIVVGGCLMVLLSFLGMQPDGTRHQHHQQG
jgi:signal peptidase II